MKTLDEMPVNDAIALHYEKHHAMQKGDMTRIAGIKK